jgi:Holliday junction resolvase-like predicted endonuclease
MSKRRGDISELQVATHYLENGYEVFRNVCSTGLIDLVVVCPKTEEIFLYDVKTMTVYKDKEGVTTMHLQKNKEN